MGQFSQALIDGDKVPLKDFETKKYFEGCLPIEVMNERGRDTLRFGPMKPVGLPDPRTGKDAYAIVQLRMEDREGTHYNMVGFQTKLTYPAQKKIFKMIPGMEQCEFLRLGSIHRNTFVCGPRILEPTLQMKKHPHILLAGQISGVEGYVESAATGLLAGRNASALALGKEIPLPPEYTAHGALIHHLTTEVKRFQPSNINYSLFPPFDKKAYKATIPKNETAQQKKGKRRRWRISKKDKAAFRSQKALAGLQRWLAETAS
jgi:methylenetetrahydrofolate--tRNA-(uracil-5-)-methyltransferase